MRPRDERAYLYDISAACTHIAEFTAGRSVEDYRQDALVRSAVERQFETVRGDPTRQTRHEPDIIPTNPTWTAANFVPHGPAQRERIERLRTHVWYR